MAILGEPLITVVADRSRIEELLDLRRPAEALELVDAALSSGPRDPELLELRVLCLERIGQFEAAIELGRLLLDAHPDLAGVRDRLAPLEAAMAPPTHQTPPSQLRSYATAVPRTTLLSIQQAVHHYHYKGIQLVKSPFDLALYPMLLWELRPRTVIEIGSKCGGSAIWLADLLASFGDEAHVHSYDVVAVRGVEHPGVTFHRGNGQRLEEAIDHSFIESRPRPLLVIEDADHSYETSIATLRFFEPAMAVGEYIVIEDGNLSDIYPEQYPNHTSGPHRAIREFLADHGERWAIDSRLCDFFGYNATAASNGFLRRVAA